MTRLADKVAVVTGGGVGIGRAIAKRFADEGAHVAVADIGSMDDVKRDVTVAGRRFFASRCDASRPDQVNAFAEGVLKEFGRCDILVNNVVVYPLTAGDTGAALVLRVD